MFALLLATGAAALALAVRAVLRRHRPAGVEPDWWPRFEEAFRAYALE